MSNDQDCNCRKSGGADNAAQMPSLQPGNASTSNSGDNSMSDSSPTLIPGGASADAGGGNAAATTGAPTLGPNTLAQSASGGQTAWNNNKRASALWGINQNRNSWVYVPGVGWKKFANNSDSAVVALTMLAANAKQSQGNYSYRDEADGMIHETYVW